MELNKLQIKWFYVLCLVFTACFIASVKFEYYPFLVIPPALFVAWLLFTSPYNFFLLTAFFIPLSIPFHTFTQSFGLILPTEPLAGLLVLYFTAHTLAARNYDSNILRHPITIVLLMNLTWMLVTCFTSTMPLVSFKYLILRTTYVIVFFFFCIPFFRQTKEIIRFIKLFTVSFTITMIFVIVRHSQYGFIRDVFPYMAQPFYWNHGIYSSTLAFLLPAMVVFIFYAKHFNLSYATRVLLTLLCVVMCFSVIFSYTRATWVSLIAAFAAWIIFELKLSVRFMFVSIFVALLSIVVFQKEIMLKLRDNEQGSTRKSDLGEHFKSISNIKNDPSNLERINRWNSAIRMTREKPLYGFGPGTYQFQYSRYQKWSERTVISTDFGLVGHAHSEYLGPLSEGGIPGALTWIGFFILTLYKGIMLVYHAQSKRNKALALGAVLGLITYYVHGVLNSYVDYDKLASLLFAFTGMIVALDLNKREQIESR